MSKPDGRDRLQTSRRLKCTLLVPAFNESHRIWRCLNSVHAESLPPGCAWDRWLILDDSDDGTADVARRWGRDHPEVSLVVASSSQRAGKAARLSGAHRQLLESGSLNTVVVVLDADSIVGPGSIEAILAPFQRDETLAVAWGSDRADNTSFGRWASSFQMALLAELAHRLGDSEPRAYGRFFAYRLRALAEFTWSPNQLDDLQLSTFVSERRLRCLSAWSAVVEVTPASGFRDFYRQTYRSYEALRRGGLQGRPQGLRAAVHVTLPAVAAVSMRHPAWFGSYLTARVAAAAQHRVARSSLGPLWEAASSTKGRIRG